jgi:hypothetical protein
MVIPPTMTGAGAGGGGGGAGVIVTHGAKLSTTNVSPPPVAK